MAHAIFYIYCPVRRARICAKSKNRKKQKYVTGSEPLSERRLPDDLAHNADCRLPSDTWVDRPALRLFGGRCILRCRRTVVAASRGRQTPWSTSALTGYLRLFEAPNESAAPIATAPEASSDSCLRGNERRRKLYLTGKKLGPTVRTVRLPSIGAPGASTKVCAGVCFFRLAGARIALDRFAVGADARLRQLLGILIGHHHVARRDGVVDANGGLERLGPALARLAASCRPG